MIILFVEILWVEKLQHDRSHVLLNEDLLTTAHPGSFNKLKFPSRLSLRYRGG